MKINGWFDWKKSWSLFTVLLLYVPAFFWWSLWSGGTVLQWWRGLEGKISTSTFFEWEEFIALHSHSNEWPGRVGFYLIIVVSVVFIMLNVVKIIKTETRMLLVPLLFTLFVLFFSICLCQSKEKQNRKSCQRNLSDFQKAYVRYQKKYGYYPDELLSDNFPADEALRYELNENCKRFGNYLYPGAGQKKSNERFIVIEDAPRTHAGDLRHRLWSDGTIDSYYPWKTEGGLK